MRGLAKHAPVRCRWPLLVNGGRHFQIIDLDVGAGAVLRTKIHALEHEVFRRIWKASQSFHSTKRIAAQLAQRNGPLVKLRLVRQCLNRDIGTADTLGRTGIIAGLKTKLEAETRKAFPRRSHPGRAGSNVQGAGVRQRIAQIKYLLSVGRYNQDMGRDRGHVRPGRAGSIGHLSPLVAVSGSGARTGFQVFKMGPARIDFGRDHLFGRSLLSWAQRGDVARAQIHRNPVVADRRTFAPHGGLEQRGATEFAVILELHGRHLQHVRTVFKTLFGAGLRRQIGGQIVGQPE